MNKEIPKFVYPFLWSYDISRLDAEKDKKRIITNILNLGTDEALEWLFSTYKKSDIIDVLRNPLSGEWDKKSFRLWTLIFDIHSNVLLHTRQ